MTEAGSIVGTAQYLSPEQARGGSVDQRSDLYSLGIVLNELLTGSVPFTGDSPVEIAMKHLSGTPEPPSAKRPDLPRELDLVVTRALAKDPDERYQTAEEMDADLERVARGLGVSPETESAATAIIARPPASPATITGAPTTVTRGAPPPVYYDYEDEPRRRRPFWPWLIVLLLVIAAAGAGWYAYQQIQDQLAANEPVAVPDVVGLREALAVAQLDEKNLAYEVVRRPNRDQPAGFVYDQDPNAGRRVDRETDSVTILVSTGIPQTTVPDVRGQSRDDAVAALTAAKLQPRVVEINSKQPANSVTAQDPKPGNKVDEGTTVRINVSKGPKPLGVPSVEGQPFESANSTLQAAGFTVARKDVDSNQPAGIVVAQDPAGGSFAARGAVVTLSVSKGPTTSQVPDVTSLDRDTAIETLRSSGFRVQVTEQDTDDPSLDNVVLAQDPEGFAEAEPRSVVTITVGRFVEPPPTETVP
jgi:serine/threonine-protein kinase